MTKAENLIGHCMKHFYEQSTQPNFNLFAEIVLYIQQMSDEKLEEVLK